MTDFAALQQKLKTIQVEVKQVDAQREKLSRAADIEEHTAKQSIARLKDLGVENAEAMSIADLQTLLNKTQKALEANLTELSGHLEASKKVYAEYEATAVTA